MVIGTRRLAVAEERAEFVSLDRADGELRAIGVGNAVKQCEAPGAKAADRMVDRDSAGAICRRAS